MNLSYYDFALDEFKYLALSYVKGLRFNAMVAQSQRVCELLFKHMISRELFNNDDIMMYHNLRKLYDYLVDTLGYDLSTIRSNVMLLNNFYTHTRYPGKDSFLAKEPDIVDSFKAISSILGFLQKEYLNGPTSVFSKNSRGS